MEEETNCLCHHRFVRGSIKLMLLRKQLKKHHESLGEKFKSIFLFRGEVKTEELLQIIYGSFSNLKDYTNLIPKEN